MESMLSKENRFVNCVLSFVIRYVSERVISKQGRERISQTRKAAEKEQYKRDGAKDAER